MTKKILSGPEARQAIFKGIEKVYKAVSSTLGPAGKNVLIEVRGRQWPHITKDGATVAKYIDLKDQYENQGAQLLKAISMKTATEVGDGTTTATILGHYLIKEALKLVETGASVVALEAGMKKAAEEVSNYINHIATKTEVKDILNIAKMSVNGDEKMAKFIAQAFETGDAEMAMVIEDNRHQYDEIEVVNGWQWNRGYFAANFVNEMSRMRAVMINPLIFMTDQELTNQSLMVPILNFARGVDQKESMRVGQEVPLLKDGAPVGARPLIIVAKEVSPIVLSMLAQNQERGAVQVCPIRAPGYVGNMNDYLNDIKAFVGGKVFDAVTLNNLSQLSEADFGMAEKVIVEQSKTSIIGAKNEKGLEKRLEEVRCLEKQATAEYERKDLRQRISKLKGRIAVLKVGAPTEVEANEKKDRYEDSLYAVKAALKNGHVAGGGVLLKLLSQDNKGFIINTLEGDEELGRKLLIKSLAQPAQVLYQNADRIKDLENIFEPNKDLKLSHSDKLKGYNLRTNKKELVELYKEGIIEPAEVLTTAISQAVSMAVTVLKTATLIVYDEDQELLEKIHNKLK